MAGGFPGHQEKSHSFFFGHENCKMQLFGIPVTISWIRDTFAPENVMVFSSTIILDLGSLLLQPGKHATTIQHRIIGIGFL